MTEIKKFENVNVNNSGVASTNFTPDGTTPIGIHKIVGTYNENDTYQESVSDEKEFVVNRRTVCTIANAIGNSNEQISLIADVTGDGFTVDDGLVKFKVAGTIVGTANVTNGKAILPYTITCVDESTLQAEYDGIRGNYAPAVSNIAKIDVRHNSNLFVQNVTLNKDEQLNVTGDATFTDDNNQTVNIASGSGEFFIDGVKYSDITIANGKFTLSGLLPSYTGGIKQGRVTMVETDDYTSAEYTFNINVRIETVVQPQNISGNPGQTITLTADVRNKDLLGIVNEGTVKFTVDGVDAIETVVNGVASHQYTLPANAEGTINFTAQFLESTNYSESASATGVITVREEVFIEIPNMEATVGDNITITATVKDGEGNPVQEGDVTFEITKVE